LIGAGEPVLIRGARASPHYFDIFGATPALGRMFLPGDDQPGNHQVVLLSHLFWETRFGADPTIIGRDIVLNGESYTVIGVLQKGGPFDRAAAQIWIPLAFQPSDMTRDLRWLGGTAKLRPGVTLEEARAEMDVIARRLASAYPGSNEDRGIAVDRLGDVLIGEDVKTAVGVLFAATALVLLTGCANLANLAVGRSMAREPEVALRAAVGASRWELVRQFLIESVLVSACGGVVAVGVGYAMLKWILSWIPPFALPPAVDVGMDTSTLMFGVVVAIVTGLLFGSVPALQLANPTLTRALKAAGHGTTAIVEGRRMRSVLVVSEIAVAFVLLAAASLLMRSFYQLLEIDPGFVARNVLTARLPVVQEEHPDPVELNVYLDEILTAVKGVPGVRAAALTSVLPLQGWGYGVPYSIGGRESKDGPHRRPAFFKIVSPSYFETLGIRLRAGRWLTAGDRSGSARVAIINETLARREFAEQDAIGQRIIVRELLPGTAALGEEIAWTIVGVIAGEKITGMGDAISAGIYVSNQQSPTYDVDLIVQAGIPPESLHRALRAAVDRVNRDQAFSDVRTLDEIVRQSMMGNRAMSLLVSTFALLALVLAVMGIYAVLAHTVGQRSREMAIRAALGATPGSLRSLLARGGMRLALVGVAIGFAGTLASTRLLSALLYGVNAHDPLTIAIVAAVLLGTAAVASYLSASRITSVNPLDLLRSQ
jgi:putative ABC transport system permease protein